MRIKGENKMSKEFVTKEQWRSIRINYLRNLITKMQCADMGVVDDETYNTAIAELMDLVEQQRDYFDSLEGVQ